MAVQDNASKAYLARVEKSFRRDYEGKLPASLVVPSSYATWIEQDKIPNPARIGHLLSLPTKSFEISLQQIPAHGATDLHRKAKRRRCCEIYDKFDLCRRLHRKGDTMEELSDPFNRSSGDASLCPATALLFGAR